MRLSVPGGVLLALIAHAAVARPPTNDAQARIGDVRTVKEYFETLDRRFHPAAARGVNGVIQFELSGVEGCAYFLTIQEARMTLVRGVALQPQVTIRMNGTDYIKVVNGEMSGSAAYLSGAMKIRGKLSLARKLSQIFPPGRIDKVASARAPTARALSPATSERIQTAGRDAFQIH